VQLAPITLSGTPTIAQRLQVRAASGSEFLNAFGFSMDRSSGLEDLDAGSLSCSNKLTVQAGNGYAFLNSKVQVGGIVDS
jgi:hypothetical protein